MADINQVRSGMFGGADSALGMVAKYVTWLLIALIILAFFYFIYLFFAYKFRAEIFVRRNVGVHNSSDFAIGQIKKDWVREINQKGVRKWKFFLSRKTIEPLDDKYILPKNKVKLFQTGTDSFVPVVFRSANPEAVFQPLPQSIRFWEQLEIQQAVQDYQSEKFWDKYGSHIALAGTVLFCCILVAGVIWMSYQHANGVVTGLKDLSGAIRASDLAQAIAPS